jgi:type II secretory pathway pseudopilin PulG
VIIGVLAVTTVLSLVVAPRRAARREEREARRTVTAGSSPG